MATPKELPLPIVALVTDRRVCFGEDQLVEAVEQAVSGGVNLVQVRERDLSQNDLLALARRLRDVTRRRALLFVNGDLNVALLSGAEGVHLPQASMGELQKAVPQGLASCAVHDLDSARRAARGGAHLLVAGSVFESQSHPGQAPAGTGLIKEISAAVEVPVIGIGGITAEKAGEVMEAGAAGVAVIREVLAAKDVTAAAMALREAVEAAWAKRTAPQTEEVG